VPPMPFAAAPIDCACTMAGSTGRPNVLHRVEARQRDPRCFRIDAACATCAASL
jgi:hypothetical protein